LVTVALACSEACRGSGADFIEALLGGYEAQLRFCDAYSFQAIGMHAVSTVGFVAPLTVGRATGMNVSQLAHAVALNGMRHLALFGLVKGELSMAKAIGAPLASVEAVDACQLAARGFTGPLGIIEWLFAQLPQGIENTTDPALGLTLQSYRVESVTLKRYPVQFEIQGAVEAALKLASALPSHTAMNIAKVTVSATAEAKERTADPSKYRPSNRETADHSLPCCVAMALLDGRLTSDQFEEGRWSDGDVLDLMARIDVVADEVMTNEYPAGRPSRVSITLQHGEVLTESVGIPLGDAKRPLPPEEVRRKFCELAASHFPASRIDEMISAIGSLENLKRVSELTALFRP
jgi:2-methylcitrate dehydratase